MAAIALAAAEVNDGKLNRLVAAQLQKTKMCAMHQRGTCRDPKCRFAHDPAELRTAPDLTKTAICRMFTRGACRNSGCKFAHGEQELRVTPTVYKTQLCNFHMRGHCKKGNRCRHAHGEDELRSFLSQASTSPPRTATPTFSDDSPSSTNGDRPPIAVGDDADLSPYRNSGVAHEAADFTSQDLVALMSASPHGRWSPAQGPTAEWWAAYLAAGGGAAGHNRTAAATPPPTNMLYPSVDAQPTPEKVVPPLPFAQRGNNLGRPGSPAITEPMKVALSPSNAAAFSTSSPLGNAVLPPPLGACLAGAGAPAHEDVRQMAAQMAWAEQAKMQAAMQAKLKAKMDMEMAAAQLKVQEYKRQLYTAAQFATTTANVNGLPMPGSQESHFESIMQTLQKVPSRPESPVDMVLLHHAAAARVATPPPGLETMTQGSDASNGGSPVLGTPREVARPLQPWHPTDISHQKHGTAWVI